MNLDTSALRFVVHPLCMCACVCCLTYQLPLGRMKRHSFTLNLKDTLPLQCQRPAGFSAKGPLILLIEYLIENMWLIIISFPGLNSLEEGDGN